MPTRIKGTDLTIHPRKYSIATEETKYLGYVLEHGVIQPQVGKVEAIRTSAGSTTKKQLRLFLGLVGWYSCFIPNFSARSSVLTELTRKAGPNKVRWTTECETAFQDLKESLY